jgi:hypothetical protein
VAPGIQVGPVGPTSTLIFPSKLLLKDLNASLRPRKYHGNNLTVVEMPTGGCTRCPSCGVPALGAAAGAGTGVCHCGPCGHQACPRCLEAAHDGLCRDCAEAPHLRHRFLTVRAVKHVAWEGHERAPVSPPIHQHALHTPLSRPPPHPAPAVDVSRVLTSAQLPCFAPFYPSTPTPPPATLSPSWHWQSPPCPKRS